MLPRFLAIVAGVGLVAPQAPPPAARAAPPVIDMHVHSTQVAPTDLTALEKANVRYIFLAGLASDLRIWAGEAEATRYLPSLVFPCDRGRAPITGRPCYEGPSDFPDPGWLRGELAAGRIRAFGEVTAQLLGMGLDDARLEPFWELAEEFDIPVGVHLGPGPPGASYESSPAPFKSPAFRMAAGDPLRLEDVLLRHKRLRVFVMHAAWPLLDSMIALLYAHPHVYVDTAALQAPFVTPRAGYYRHLQGLVDAGFGQRIMFGSDFKDQLHQGIDAISTADFLSPEQKADILCHNAARFLRLDAAICAP